MESVLASLLEMELDMSSLVRGLHILVISGQATAGSL
mgnify:FL=1